MTTGAQKGTIMLLWTAFGSTWLLFIGFAVWAVREHVGIRQRVSDVDKEQAIQLMRLETELKHINMSLGEIKERLAGGKR